MRHWFLPETPDLIGLLQRQAAVTRDGMQQFVSWSRGETTEQAVRDAEHAADDAKRAVQAALRTAFSTPLDPEDIYELSERMDAVVNAAKNIVAEATVIAMEPDASMAAMAAHLGQGQLRLVEAFAALTSDDDAAIAASDGAVRTVRDLERSYRLAMSELLDESDLREVMGRRELYRRYSRTGDAVEAVAARVWYALVKLP